MPNLQKDLLNCRSVLLSFFELVNLNEPPNAHFAAQNACTGESLMATDSLMLEPTHHVTPHFQNLSIFNECKC